MLLLLLVKGNWDLHCIIALTKESIDFCSDKCNVVEYGEFQVPFDVLRYWRPAIGVDLTCTFSLWPVHKVKIFKRRNVSLEWRVKKTRLGVFRSSFKTDYMKRSLTNDFDFLPPTLTTV